MTTTPQEVEFTLFGHVLNDTELGAELADLSLPELNDLGSALGATENPDAKGVTENPAAEGVTEKPAAEGVTEHPDAEGVNEHPDAEGVTEHPDAKSVTENPDAQGVTENPVITENPAAEGDTENLAAEGVTENQDAGDVTKSQDADGVTEKPGAASSTGLRLCAQIYPMILSCCPAKSTPNILRSRKKRGTRMKKEMKAAEKGGREQVERGTKSLRQRKRKNWKV